MNPTLRQATAVDAPRVASLLIDARSAFMPYAPLTHSDKEVGTWVASQLVPSGGLVVAEIQGSVVAAIHTERKDAISWITQMAVDPRFVGKGIGAFLLTHVKHTMSLPIRLYTFQANLGARRFYSRHGFVPIEFGDGRANEERCPDVLYELSAPRCEA
jgi:GNAT superfamily N-acetyltransferase